VKSATRGGRTEQAAIAALLNRNLLVFSIQEKIGQERQDQGRQSALADLVVFTRQLATMIDAGIAIVQSLQALADQTGNKVMRDVIRDICTRVESGESFSEALQKHPKAFNRLYVSMVAAGEKGGLLAEIMARLATYLENSERLRKKVKTALMYPTAVTFVAICITVFLAGESDSDLQGNLCRLRRETARTDAIFDGLAICATLPDFVHRRRRHADLGLALLHQDKIRPRILGRRRIKLPIFGPIAHKICLARFTRTLSSLVRSGVPILEVLQIVSQTVGNVVMEKAIKNAATDIERGEGISGALGKNPIFPSMIIRMMSAGEQTGNIDTMLERVSNFLDEEIENHSPA
jgi:type IV pilus assembly protein PilC